MPSKNDTPDENPYSEEIEAALRRFAINYRNKWILNKSDIIVTYVTRNFGGTWEFKELVQWQKILAVSINPPLDRKSHYSVSCDGFLF